MRHTEYGYISPAENHCYRDLERWLADKKKVSVVLISLALFTWKISKARYTGIHNILNLIWKRKKEREHNGQQPRYCAILKCDLYTLNLKG